MKTDLFISITVALTFALFSCSDNDGDTTPPAVNVISPSDGARITVGTDLYVHARFSDKEMLASYTIEIHDNSDNHHHTRDGGTSYFYYQQGWEIAGEKDKTVEHYIPVPEDAISGEYHLVVWCFDASGNETVVARDLLLVEAE
ncbi:MAG: DUF4625 domain-containing protein [Alistipes sp.]|nr:DUF4625 domain-containing protein [Alistipes sp.]